MALEELLPEQVTNLCVEVKEWKDEIVFLHKIRPGSADKSYGIHVARLAGVPSPVLGRARSILSDLESHASTPKEVGQNRSLPNESLQPVEQPGLFDQMERRLLEKIQGIQPDELSPREALDLIYELKKQTSGESFNA